MRSIFLFFVFLFSTTNAWTNEPFLFSQSYPLCSSWRFNTGGTGGYSCSFYDYGVQIVDARNLEQVIRSLEDRIKMLESQVQTLEAR